MENQIKPKFSLSCCSLYSNVYILRYVYRTNISIVPFQTHIAIYLHIRFIVTDLHVNANVDVQIYMYRAGLEIKVLV